MRIRLALSAVVLAAASCSSAAPGPSSESPPAHDTNDEETTAEAPSIRRVDFQITYRLAGTSAYGDAVGLLSNPQLSFAPERRSGSRVQPKTRVGRAMVAGDVRRALRAGSDSSSLDEAHLRQLLSLQGPISAPIGGVFLVRKNVPIVRSPGVDVVVPLTPIQYLRYQSLHFSGEASIETVIGERRVRCEAVWIVRGSDTGASSTELRCRLPRYVETGAGLPAQVTFRSERIEDAVVVPNLFVGYDEETDGYFINVVENGQERRVPIMVGVTDGVVRVVTSEVPVGATLAPVADG